MRSPEYAAHGYKQVPRMHAGWCREIMDLWVGTRLTLIAGEVAASAAIGQYRADAVSNNATGAAIPAEA